MIGKNKRSASEKLREAQKKKFGEAIKKISLYILCNKFYKLRKHGQYYYSPVRDDGRYPAFAIREDGMVGIDHGTGEAFNALTLIERVEHLSRREAAARLIYYAEAYVPNRRDDCTPNKWHAPPIDLEALVPYRWPFLGIGSHADYLAFARLRRLNPMTLITATALGLFHFFTDRQSGQRLCTVTDGARYARQDRTLTGDDVLLWNGGSSKSRTIGKPAWPVGAADIGAKSVILLAEGMPDLLAAVQIIIHEGRIRDTAAVSMLGAGQRIHAQALPLFAGKRVRVFPDNDPAGLKASDIWRGQLEEAGAIVDLFSMAAQEPALGPIKDLNDFVIAGGIPIDGNTVIPAFDTKEVA